MSAIFQLEDNLSNLPEVVQRYDNEIENAKDKLLLEGKTLVDANREQPTLYAHYSALLIELRTMEKYTQQKVDSKRGSLWLQYREHYTISLSSTDINNYIEQDPGYIEMNTFLTIIKEMHGQMSTLVKAFEQRGFTLRNLTEMHIHEVQNAVI